MLKYYILTFLMGILLGYSTFADACDQLTICDEDGCKTVLVCD